MARSLVFAVAKQDVSAREGAKEVTEQVAKQTAKEVTEQVAKQFTREGIVEAAKGGVKGVQKTIVRSLGDPNTLRGATMSEVSKLIPKGWEKMPLNKGKGVRYVNPAKPGESILIEHGWKNAKDLIHSGPYIRIARDGKILRIPLSGNPVL